MMSKPVPRSSAVLARDLFNTGRPVEVGPACTGRLPAREGDGGIPNPERLISVAWPATVPVEIDERGWTLGEGLGKGVGLGFGVGEGVGVGVGEGVGVGRGEGELGRLVTRLRVKVFESPALLLDEPVKRRSLRSYNPGPK